MLSFGISQAQRPLYDIPAPFELTPYTSGTMAITRAGRIVTSNPLANRVSIINLQGGIDAELNIGVNPRGVFVMPDNLRMLAVADGELALVSLETNEVIAQYSIDGEPEGVVSVDNLAYISLPASAEIIAVDLESGRTIQHIATPPMPAALATWGDFLYVTHFSSGAFSLIYLPAAEVVRTIQPQVQGGLSASIEIDPINGKAFLPQSIINSDGSFDNRIIPVVHVIDLKTMMVTETINLVVVDRNVNMPIAVAQPSNRSRLYIAHAGSNDVTVLNLDNRTADNHFDTGANPRAIRFNRDFTRVYVQDALDGTVSVFDTGFFGLQDQIPSHTQLIDPVIQIGARLFHTSIDERLSANHLISCMSCHSAGISNNQTMLSKDDLNNHIRIYSGGSGLDINSVDMDALIEYLRTLGMG